MRLPKPTEVKKIILSFDPEARVYLFGSRTDDNKRGGDIDLFVLSSMLGFPDKLQILLKLYYLLGEQKIDLIITATPETAFHKHAYATGIEL
ncbi:MAG: nucleotidyltransferase domain-containing protein [Candidatus Cloacimonas sp.]|jgi:predicted nucleotidyltransferase|nr:nucleotidyltransferase domain-containing protein [Candidatus Cloacimonas sp.]